MEEPRAADQVNAAGSNRAQDAPTPGTLRSDILPKSGVRGIYATKLGAVLVLLIVMWFVKLLIFPDLPAEQYSVIIILGLLPTAAVAMWRGEVPVWLLGCTFVADVVSVTAGVHFGGGVDNVSGPLLYATLIGLAGVILSERAAYLTAAGSGFLYGLMAWAEHQQWVPHRVPYAKPPEDALATVITVTAFLLVAAWVVSFAARQIRAIYAQAERMRMEAVTALSHDLKNPLGIIRAYAQMAEETGPTEGLDYLKRIQQSVQQSLDLVHNVLNGAAIAGRPVVPNLEPVSINSLVAQATQLYGTTAEVKGIQLSTTLAPGLPIVHADAQLISRALHNLVSNALKFTEAGGTVEITTKVEDDKIEITVRDSGRGIPTDEQPRLFQEFARGTSSGSIEGTGLGLYIVRRSAEAHGGSVNVVSEVGEGSTFTLSLPAAPADITTSIASSPLPRAMA